jgi:hypothetical protein
MSHLSRLGSQFDISIPPGDEGLIGRECPLPECEGYFKIQPGTGLTGTGLPCHCPYCGYEAPQNKFFTTAQIEYAKSVVLHKVTDALLKDLKTLEFNHRPRGAFGIGISMKVTGRPRPIRYYREKKLETEVICDHCTLRYTIFGVFGYCPDCGVHNSLQILNKNLDLVQKLLELAVAKTAQSQRISLRTRSRIVLQHSMALVEKRAAWSQLRRPTRKKRLNSGSRISPRRGNVFGSYLIPT